jgi:hypothetical protein
MIRLGSEAAAELVAAQLMRRFLSPQLRMLAL